MIIRVGIAAASGALIQRAVERRYDALISAGSCWRKGRFISPGLGVYGLRSVALDSAGFVAMKHHGGYPWTVAEYVDFVAHPRKGMPYPWAWWSSMDLCCEPEIAGDAAKVEARVRGTLDLLGQCRAEAVSRNIPPPMPILQGWKPADYLLCAELTETLLGGVWPDLVGVGSVCRRQEGGPVGLHAVIRALDARLPPHVKLHLFGVKGSALGSISAYGRVGSVDSCAWDSRARSRKIQERRELCKASGCDIREATRRLPNSVVERAEEMDRWMEAAGQHAARVIPRQMGIFW